MSSSTITIHPVTRPTDLPTLASIFDNALQSSGDAFHTIIDRYSGQTVFEDTVDKLTKALNNPQSEFVFKAVETTRSSNGDLISEQIVGVSQWFVGYIELPKYDPFSPSPATSQPSEEAKGEAAGAPPLAIPVSENSDSQINPALIPEPTEIDFYARFIRPMRNIYIAAIRGKRHVYLRRIAVLPTHQRRGIASRLLQWGVDVADQGKMVCYLNARPAGRPLYDKVGWKALGEMDWSVPGLEVAPLVPMMRARRD